MFLVLAEREMQLLQVYAITLSASSALFGLSGLCCGAPSVVLWGVARLISLVTVAVWVHSVWGTQYLPPPPYRKYVPVTAAVVFYLVFEVPRAIGSYPKQCAVVVLMWFALDYGRRSNFWHYVRGRAPLPPGPSGWPVIGSMYKLASMYEWGVRYGPVCCAHAGAQTLVTFNSAKVAQHMLCGQFQDRNQGFVAVEVLARGGRSITMSNCNAYFYNLKSKLKPILEQHKVAGYRHFFCEEAVALLQAIYKNGDAGHALYSPVNDYVHFALNTIVRATFDLTESRESKESAALIARLKKVNDDVFAVTAVGTARLLDFFPLLR